MAPAGFGWRWSAWLWLALAEAADFIGRLGSEGNTASSGSDRLALAGFDRLITLVDSGWFTLADSGFDRLALASSDWLVGLVLAGRIWLALAQVADFIGRLGSERVAASSGSDRLAPASSDRLALISSLSRGAGYLAGWL